nr:HisA/HisF-related TIM barrel protein [Pseudenhygromyxa sp. WMMC2535]
MIPAIDLLGGKAVRLAEGDRERVTVYADEPWKLAGEFVAAGARRLHLVDLDGAFGETRQLDLLRRILTTARWAEIEARAPDQTGRELVIDVGGGIRDVDAAEALFELGVDQVVVGTLAVREPEAVAELCQRHPGGVVVAIDARDGVVAVDGWRELSTRSAAELAGEAAEWGAAALLYTDVHRDGLQVGPNVEITAQLQQVVDRRCDHRGIPRAEVIASGGVGSLADFDALREAGVRAVIVGRALYEHSFTLKEALARC